MDKIRAIFPIAYGDWWDMRPGVGPMSQPTPLHRLPIATNKADRSKVKAARKQSAKTRRKRK